MTPDRENSGKEDTNRTNPAFRKIPRFRAGSDGPQIVSSESMNRLVDAVNGLYSAQIVRGSVNRFTPSDGGVVYEISNGALDGSPMGMSASSSPTTPSTPLQAYWTLDETAGSDKVDKVNSIHLQLSSGGDVVTTGLYGNCLDIKGGGQGYDTSRQALLRTTGQGFSMFGWFKIISTGTNTLRVFLNFFSATYHPAPLLGQIFVELGNSIDPVVNFQYQDASNTHVTETVDMSSGISTGTWYFFHLFYDPFTAGGSVGMSINAGEPTYSTNADLVFKASGYGGFQVFAAAGGSPNTEVLLDETGVCTQRCLRDSEITYLYNSGAGRTWPLGTFPST